MRTSGGEMRSSSGQLAAWSHRAREGGVVAATTLLLGLLLAGCAPEAPAAGPSAGPTAEGPTPTEPAEPAPSGDEETAPVDPDEGARDDSGAETPGSDEAPSGTAAPQDGDSPAANGDPDSEIVATDDWRAPDDPAREGPTAAPSLPEVTGGLDEAVALPTEVTVSLTSITPTMLTAETPGEVSGPAVIVEVRVTNDSEETRSISSATVSLTAEDGEMGIPTFADPNDPLHGEVAPGAAAEGIYVFMLDPADERSVTVRVNSSAGAPVAVFTGATP